MNTHVVQFSAFMDHSTFGCPFANPSFDSNTQAETSTVQSQHDNEFSKDRLKTKFANPNKDTQPKLAIVFQATPKTLSL